MADNIPEINLDSAVNTCPCCGSKISPIYLTHHEEYYDVGFSAYYVICKCPNKSCNRIFFTKYIGEPLPVREGINGVEYTLDISDVTVYPYSFPDNYFEESITKLSPGFIEVYKQSVLADKMGLNKICGSGYRLSLELLIKDFASHINPEKADKIRCDTKVSNVINNRIPDKPLFDDIKNIANRAWWLGCDSSHYNKNFNSFDINDLKECINITVATIVYYLKHQHYVNSINKSKD